MPAKKHKTPARRFIGSFCFEVIAMNSLFSLNARRNFCKSVLSTAMVFASASQVQAATLNYNQTFDSPFLGADWTGSNVAVSAAAGDVFVILNGSSNLTHNFFLDGTSNFSLSFFYSAFMSVSGDVFKVSVDGSQLAAFGPLNTTDADFDAFNSLNPGSPESLPLNKFYSNSLLLGGGSHTLSFDSLGGLRMMHLDDVQYVATSVPEPGGWAMLLAGLGAMGVVGRRRRVQD
jgi:hypothetical protein